MKKRLAIGSFVLLCGVLVLFFALLFKKDNKYETPPPYGKDGVLLLSENDLHRETPLFLIDGWLLTDSRVAQRPTWIGEYSSLRRGDALASPHGAATYCLTLRYTGAPTVVAVEFQDLRSDYVVSLDGQMLAQGTGNAGVTFPLSAGDHLLTVETESQSGFYSGMYYPAALGLPQTLNRIASLRALAYALALLVPLVLAGFTFCLWSRRDDPVAFWFALLCIFFSLYVAWYFVSLFHLPVWRYWYLAEELALCGLCYTVVRLTALAAGVAQKRGYRILHWLLVAWPVCLIALSLLIPVLPGAAMLHGLLKDGYFLLVFAGIVFLAVQYKKGRETEYVYILAGDTIFGVGLLLNLFFSNRFEPIRFFWQFEWCGLFLVGLFGGMMVVRNRRVLTENVQLTSNLEQLVEKRTEELSMLLHERKAFFSDMAHDLKAPLFATQGFIDAIRRNNTGVDRELSYYLEQVELKQSEMTRRLQGLSAVNELDKIESQKERISVRELLEEVYAAHHAEAEVASVYLRVKSPEPDCIIRAQPEKLEILFENLVYNALRATGPEGSIAIVATAAGDCVRIAVSDTGCGIPEEELAHIFQRFFVRQRNKGTGTGLGLYIVQTIIKELGGTVTVFSRPGEGTEFLLTIPAEISA